MKADIHTLQNIRSSLGNVWLKLRGWIKEHPNYKQDAANNEEIGRACDHIMSEVNRMDELLAEEELSEYSRREINEGSLSL